MLAHRVRFHDALKRQAIDPNGEGPPASLERFKQVVRVDPDNATITLQDGKQITGDLILGADGISV